MVFNEIASCMMTLDVQDSDIEWEFLGEVKAREDHTQRRFYSTMINYVLVDKIESQLEGTTEQYYINNKTMKRYDKFRDLIIELFE